jgi:Tol biopolymer transport system component
MGQGAGGHEQPLFSRQKRRGPWLPVSLFVVIAIIILFSFITPANLITTINPASVRVPTLTPPPTALPTPTDIHGGTIVFTCTRKEVNQICRVNADGSGYGQLTTGNVNSYYPAISPAGRTIVFVENNGDYFDLFRIDGGPAPSAATSLPKPAQITFYVGNAFAPSFWPDSRQVMFLNRVGDKPAEIWVVDSDGKEAHSIYAPTGDVVGLEGSPNGKLLAMAMTAGARYEYEIFLLDLSNLAIPPRQLSHGLSGIGGSISWSPDQSNLLVFAGPVAAREIYRLDSQTGAATQLTFGGNNAGAAYSPDGQYIVFNSLRNGGQADLYIMRSDGHSMRQLTSNPEPDWQPQWGP